MLALLVKPGALASKRKLRAISQLEQLGAIRLKSHTAEDIRAEVMGLASQGDQIVLVACGGDGTVHLALNAIASTDVELAVVPLGTGNDFARYLGINSTRKAIEVLNSGKPQPIDAGLIEFDHNLIRYYLGIASCGFDAQVNERANGYRGPSGTVKYLAAVVGEIRSLRAKSLFVETDSKSVTGDFTLVAIGNTNSYGGGMKVCPIANASDGVFELTFVDQVSRGLLMRVLPRVFWGGHVRHPKVSQLAAKEVSISGEDFLVYADGERVGAGPAKFTIQPGFVRVWRE